MPVKITKVEFAGWKNCVKIADEKLELIVTTDVGPRIISLSTPGGKNVFCVKKDHAGLTGGEEWRLYGGHRLWHAPEHAKRTYCPDNAPVEWKQIESGISLHTPAEPVTGIEKSMEITIWGGQASVTHRLTNRSLWDVDLAVWAISVMAAGGMEILPLPQCDTGLLPNCFVSFWPYAKISDPRAYYGKRFMTLTQDTQCDGPWKIGYASEHNWAAYCINEDLFIKRFSIEEETHSSCGVGNPYPDNGCSYETYTCDFMLEMESLSRMSRLAPGGVVEHTELWELHKGVERPAPDDEAAMELIAEKYMY